MKEDDETLREFEKSQFAKGLEEQGFELKWTSIGDKSVDGLLAKSETETTAFAIGSGLQLARNHESVEEFKKISLEQGFKSFKIKVVQDSFPEIDVDLPELEDFLLRAIILNPTGEPEGHFGRTPEYEEVYDVSIDKAVLRKDEVEIRGTGIVSCSIVMDPKDNDPTVFNEAFSFTFSATLYPSDEQLALRDDAVEIITMDISSFF